MSRLARRIQRAQVPATPDNPPGTWATLFATRNISGLAAWYVANTGHRQTPTLTVGNVQVTTAWLNAQPSANVTQEGGRWIVSRVKADVLRPVANNVTFRDCVVESNGGYHGMVSPVGENPTGIIIEYCTINGQGADWLGIQFPQATEPNQIVVQRCNIMGYRCGIQIIGGLNAIENYVHDLYYDPVDPHVTSMSIRARNVNVLRNWLSDGNSAALAFYNETSPYTNILAEQNIVSTQQAYWEVAYTGNYPPGANTVRFIGNLLERGDFAGGHNFSEVSGNMTWAGSPVLA